MNEQKSFITKIAWDYYINNFTQQEIADRFQISRLKVTRLLQKARDMGIVKITIELDGDYYFEKEEQLKKLLNIPRVIITPTGADQDSTENSLGLLGARRLNRMLSSDDVLGVAWGKTLYAVAKNLKPVRKQGDERIQVVQLLGGLSVSDKINPDEIVKMFAKNLDAKAFVMNVPAIVSSRIAREILLEDAAIKPIFEKARSCSVCLLGIGNLSENSSLYMSGAYSVEDMAELKALGAVGDIISRPFDIRGNLINHPVTERIMAIPLEEIRKIENRIAIAFGKDKISAIIGASRGGFINELITDEETASLMINRY